MFQSQGVIVSEVNPQLSVTSLLVLDVLDYDHSLVTPAFCLSWRALKVLKILPELRTSFPLSDWYHRLTKDQDCGSLNFSISPSLRWSRKSLPKLSAGMYLTRALGIFLEFHRQRLTGESTKAQVSIACEIRSR